MTRKELHNIIIEGKGDVGAESHSTRNFYADKNVGLSIYPEPHQERQYVLSFHTSVRERANIIITNSAGKIVLQKEKQCQPGFKQCKLDMTGFEAGGYNITLLSQNGAQYKSVFLKA